MAMVEMKVYLIHASLLTEPKGFTQAWDGKRGDNNPENWPLKREFAKQWDNFQEVWNRFQQLYAANRHQLNRVTFSLIETTRTYDAGMPIDPATRMEELHKHFSPQEFKPK